jgi:predicted transcriptional regulator of viral defense system
MSKTAQVLEIANQVGVVRVKELESQGFHRKYLERLEEQGLLIRSGRGIYTSLEAEITESHSLVEVAKRVPHGVVCLLSALSFYDLTTQNPFEVWLAIHYKKRSPKDDLLSLRTVYMSGKAWEEGVQIYEVEGVPVRIYCLAKTVVDCFKYRHKIGLDVALEALKECLRQRRCQIDELWYYAKICRVKNVMRPYLEALGE